MNIKIICISGKAGSGKDTSAWMLKSELEKRGQVVLITHFADLLKYICKSFFGWDGVKDAQGRSLLQYVGTDVIRAKIPDFWVSFIANLLKLFPDRWDYVLIPDCRFPNEFELFEELGFDVSLLRVNRSGEYSVLSERQKNHPSETALDGYYYTYIIENSGDLTALESKIADLSMELIKGGDENAAINDSI